MIETLVKDEIDSQLWQSSMKIWVREFLRELVTMETTSELKELLLEIGRRAYFTTFVDDYGYSKDGLELSRLKDYPRANVEKCLLRLLEKGEMFVPEYIREFMKEYDFQPDSDVLKGLAKISVYY